MVVRIKTDQTDQMLAFLFDFLVRVLFWIFIVYILVAAFSVSPSDLEILVLARLELSAISLQRYHAVTAGSLVYSAMRSLEDAAVLNELDTDKR